MTTRNTIATITTLINRWPDLVESRIKGTPRPWREQPTERHQVEEGVGFGSVPAPVHLDVMTAMAELLDVAYGLHEHVAQTVGHPRLAPPVSVYDDVRPYLAYVAATLSEACDTDPDMAEAAHEKAVEMSTTLFTKLGEVTDGQRLDAVCPFCLGRTPKRPAGGDRTLVVRIIPARAAREPGEEEAVIVCENPVECPVQASECGLWVHGRPAWPWTDWEWLGERLLNRKDVDLRAS